MYVSTRTVQSAYEGNLCDDYGPRVGCGVRWMSFGRKTAGAECDKTTDTGRVASVRLCCTQYSIHVVCVVSVLSLLLLLLVLLSLLLLFAVEVVEVIEVAVVVISSSLSTTVVG